MDLDKYKKSYEEIMELQRTKNVDFYKHPSRYYLEPFKIAGNVYYIGDKKVCSHLIDTGDGLIVFDSGFQHTVHLMVQAIWELGFNPKDIKYLIHSHEHFDHIGAANDFKDLYGCKLAISKTGAEIFRKRPELVYMDSNPYPYASIFTPDIELEDGQVITLGNVSIRCINTPGHSPGVMSFFFDTIDNGTTYHVGYFGGAGYNTLYKKALENDNLPLSCRQQFLDSLQKVRNEPVDIVLGNHPLQNDTLEKRKRMQNEPGTNPFIDSSEWVNFVDTLTEKFNEFLAAGN
ncbi:MBL fold metallo-hydrolase [Lacrimispora sp.]|uniref:MBL fold metallo-hydrolase n=1 Tax=Lacrimispora sp. TaxID=2719234 RepID=UPI0029DF9DA8|nr:metallo-beta-lactamase class [Lacrimispora sp.]